MSRILNKVFYRSPPEKNIEPFLPANFIHSEQNKLVLTDNR